jgi:hypothetical protein
VAVGYSEDGYGAGIQQTLAERWTGTQWTIQPTPNPADEYETLLDGVSCTSSTACTAVGISGNPSIDETPTSLAERWNGTKWTIQPTPNRSTPAGGTELNGVSCTGPTACTAVGYVGDSRYNIDDVPLAERWNGTKWTIQQTPIPAGSTSTALYAVSCSSTTACTAVGNSSAPDSGNPVPLVERWNGARWTIQPTPDDPVTRLGFDDVLKGVSCTSSSACLSVGDSLAERWNGTGWTTVLPPEGSNLIGVSCTSSTACMIVGSFDTSGVSSAAVLNGTKWTILSSPSP